MDTVVILGAGCSKGLARLPTDEDFVQHCFSDYFGLGATSLNTRKPLPDDLSFVLVAYNHFYSKLRNMYGGGLADGERLEVFWNEIDEHYNYRKSILTTEMTDSVTRSFLSLAEKENKEPLYFRKYAAESTLRSAQEYFFIFAGWQLRKKVAETYGYIADRTTLENYRLLLKKIKSVGECDFPTIVSFNYDTLPEQAWEAYHYWGLHDLNYRNEQINIIKPHGSVNWLHRQEEVIIEQALPIPPEKVGYYGDQLQQHSLIGLVANKREFDKKPDQDPLVAALYSYRLVECIKRALKKAEHLIVIGYSFPITDTYMKKIILDAGLGRLKKITFVSKMQKEEAQKKFRLFFSKAIGLDFSWDQWNHEDNGVEIWLKKNA